MRFLAGVADLFGQLADQVHAQAADRPVVDVGVEVGLGVFERIEGHAVVAEFQRDQAAVNADADADFVFATFHAAVVERVADHFLGDQLHVVHHGRVHAFARQHAVDGGDQVAHLALFLGHLQPDMHA